LKRNADTTNDPVMATSAGDGDSIVRETSVSELPISRHANGTQRLDSIRSLGTLRFCISRAIPWRIEQGVTRSSNPASSQSNSPIALKRPVRQFVAADMMAGAAFVNVEDRPFQTLCETLRRRLVRRNDGETERIEFRNRSREVVGADVRIDRVQIRYRFPLPYVRGILRCPVCGKDTRTAPFPS
jgi:hypothetical protein